ncbi:MAG TPA: GNAT family N-acetyltransferase [Phycisphaerae bacterium]
MPDELHFERFDKSRHRREDFDCGDAHLNDFLKTKLNQQMRRGVTVGYVLVDSTGRIAGYVTLSAGELPIGIIPPGHGFPLRLPLPTTLIGRLAVDKRFQGRGLGGDLLVFAMRIAVQTAERVASAVIEVDALDERARIFYRRYGFARLPDDELHMYLPMADASALVERVFGTAR